MSDDDETRVQVERHILLHIRFLGGEMDEVNRLLAARLGIGRTTLRALDHLHRAGDLSAGRLTESLHLTTGATTAVIDGLVQSGHAARLSDPTDRRRTVVRATRHSVESAREIFGSMRESMLRRMEGYSTEELRLVAGFLGVLREEVVNHAGRLTPPRPGC